MNFSIFLFIAYAVAVPVSSYVNIRAVEPASPIFPSKAPGDAPYSVAESDLRAAIKIPQGFTYGMKMPVILSPGTGVTGTQTFSGNFMKLLANSTTVEPVVLDIPDNLLDDVQVNAEYVAYAMNYVSGVSNNAKVSVVTWSQGSINMQWAVKYWPSTVDTVSDFVAVSPDIGGTTVANILGMPPPTGIIPLAPALLQQVNTAQLIKTLRSDGGDSAIVPTTTIYSNADEIVMPQDGATASGFFLDANGVGASNSQVQTVCPNQPAGGAFTHEGVLYNSLAFALAMDAFANDGPGQVSRLDLPTVCGAALAPGLTAADKSTTDATIPTAANNVFAYSLSKKAVTKEPAIKAYALSGKKSAGRKST